MRETILAFFVCAVTIENSVQATETTSFSYDELGRLKSTVVSGTVNTGKNTVIEYDAAGNRKNYKVDKAGMPQSTGALMTCGYTSSVAWTNYSGFSGDGSAMRDGVYDQANSVHVADTSANSWVKMDLCTSKTISTVVVAPISRGFDGWGWPYLNSAKLEISVDGTSWTTVTPAMTGVYDKTATEFAVSGTGRYVRISSATYVGVGDFYATG